MALGRSDQKGSDFSCANVVKISSYPERRDRLIPRATGRIGLAKDKGSGTKTKD
jgi:hypothetical protein